MLVYGEYYGRVYEVYNYITSMMSYHLLSEGDTNNNFPVHSVLKLKLVETFEEKIHSFSDLDCGYLEKCSNAKHWIEDNQDLEAMYKAFSHPGDEIALWCENQRKGGKKRKIDSVVEGDERYLQITQSSCVRFR